MTSRLTPVLEQPAPLYSRFSVFLTLPHVIFSVALVVLSVLIAVTVRKESSRQLEADHLAQRCAFVYLAPSNHTNIRNLGSSIQSLNRLFKLDFKYKIIIIHETIPPLVQGRLQAVSEAPLLFREFSLQRPNSELVLLNKTTVAYKPGEGKKQSIQLSGRFWAYTALLNDPAKAPIFVDIDYVIRLDQDWAFNAPIKQDFVREFVLSGAQYGHLENTHQDCSQNASNSLRQLATSYIELNGIFPRSRDLWSSIVESSEKSCLPHFENHLELINLRFFRSHSGVQDWIRVLDANGGIFTSGWGDHVLRFVTVALFAVPEKVTKFDVKLVPYTRIQGSRK